MYICTYLHIHIIYIYVYIYIHVYTCIIKVKYIISLCLLHALSGPQQAPAEVASRRSTEEAGQGTV